MPGAVANALVLPALDDFHLRFPQVDLAIASPIATWISLPRPSTAASSLGDLPDSGLIARRLGSLEHVTCASPAYLSRRGMPVELDDLATHVAVNWLSQDNGRVVDFDSRSATARSA